VPPSFPTTSSVAVAVAAARILEAYLSNHKLSPAEAASLGGRIAEALGSLTSHAGVKNEISPASGTEPAAKRRGKSRMHAKLWAAAPEPVAAVAEFEFDSEFEPDPEPEPQPMAEPAVMVAEAEPEESPVPEAAETQVYQPEAAGPAEVPRKRKRPSRPRSRRGQGAGAAQASEAPPGDPPEDEAPPADEPRGEAVEAVPEAAPEAADADADAGGVAESSSVAVKPRRTAGRARRVTTP
jgi:hypothetical protein